MTVEAQFVSLPLDLAMPLLPQLRDPQQREASFENVRKLIARGDATLIGWLRLVTADGMRAFSHSVEEVRYTSEFEPPSEPQTFGVYRAHSPPLQTNYFGLPVAMETREAGISFTAKPVVQENGHRIEFDLEFHHVSLSSFRKARFEKAFDGTETYLGLPEFRTSESTSTVSVTPGQPILLSFDVASKPKPHVEMVFLKASLKKPN